MLLVLTELKNVIIIFVPQGLSLSPLLFSLYIAPLSQFFSHLVFVIIITMPMIPKSTFRYLEQILQPRLACWKVALPVCFHGYCINGLQLNPTKSELIQFTSDHRHYRVNDIPHVTVCNAVIQSSPTVKSLGVIFDCQLTFDEHVASITKTLGDAGNVFIECKLAVEDDTEALHCRRRLDDSVAYSDMWYVIDTIASVITCELNHVAVHICETGMSWSKTCLFHICALRHVHSSLYQTMSRKQLPAPLSASGLIAATLCRHDCIKLQVAAEGSEHTSTGISSSWEV